MPRSSTGSAARSGGRVGTSPPPRSRRRWRPTTASRSARCSASRCHAPAVGPGWPRSSCARAATSMASPLRLRSTTSSPPTRGRCSSGGSRAMRPITTTTPKRSPRVSGRRARVRLASRPPPRVSRRSARRGGPHTELPRATRHHGRVQSTLCGRPVAADRPLIMAIVNRTPDSFYDKGANFTDEAARAAVHQALADGADVIDVGGVKAGPGQDVDAATELTRLVPFVEWLRGAYPDSLISVDTWRSEVARVACAAGADLINDTWAGVDPALPEVAAEFGVGLVCSHTGGALPRTRPFRVSYGSTTRGVVDDVIRQVTDAAERAVAAGRSE